MLSLPELLALPYGQSSSGTLSQDELLNLSYDGSSPFSQGLTADDFRKLVQQYGERVRWLRAVEGTTGPNGAPPTKNGKFFVEVPLAPEVRVFLSQDRRETPSEEFAGIVTGETTLSFLPDELDPLPDDRFVALDRAYSERYFFTPSGNAFDALTHKDVIEIKTVFSSGQTLAPASYSSSARGIEWMGAPPTHSVTVLYSFHPHFEWQGASTRQGPLGTDSKRLPTSGPLRLLSAREE